MSEKNTGDLVRNILVVSNKDCNVFECCMDISLNKEMYHTMFNAVTHATKMMQEAMDILCTAQQKCEQLFIERGDTPQDLFGKSDE